MSDWYSASGAPATSSAGSSATMRGEFSAIRTAMDKLPPITGNANLPIFVNAGASALEAVSSTTARSRLGLAIGEDVQAYDAELAALAALTSAADKLPYFTGAGTASVATFTAAARTLIDDISIADMRSTLGLVIGTDVQAHDAALSSIAGLATATDTMIYTTAADTYAVATLTSAGRALLDDANAAAQRATLGLGTIATQSSSSVAITGGTISGITDLTIADGGTGASTAVAARTNLGVEPAFTKNSGFNKNFGTLAGTVSEGNHNHDAIYLKLSNIATNSALTSRINTLINARFSVVSGVLDIDTFV